MTKDEGWTLANPTDHLVIAQVEAVEVVLAEAVAAAGLAAEVAEHDCSRALAVRRG